MLSQPKNYPHYRGGRRLYCNSFFLTHTLSLSVCLTLCLYLSPSLSMSLYLSHICAYDVLSSIYSHFLSSIFLLSLLLRYTNHTPIHIYSTYSINMCTKYCSFACDSMKIKCLYVTTVFTYGCFL